MTHIKKVCWDEGWHEGKKIMGRLSIVELRGPPKTTTTTKTLLSIISDPATIESR